MWTLCQTDVDSSPLEEKDKRFRIFEDQIIMNTIFVVDFWISPF